MVIHLIRRRAVASLAAMLALAVAGSSWAAAPSSDAGPIEFTLPSAEPSGNTINDQIWVSYYPARTPLPAPAVVLVHALGEECLRMMQQFARFLAARGIGGAVMTLPYHMHRRPPGDKPQRHFLDADVDRVAQALSQSASDVSAVTTWLCRQPGVDPRRIGVIGVSLGAIVAHLAMGRDPRLDAGVAILGGGDLAGLRRTSLVFRIRGSPFTDRLDTDRAARLGRVDPITWAGNNRPRKVLMIQAARDLLMPPRHALALWAALGRPPIQWVDTNHYALGLAAAALMRVSAAYLHSVWDTPSSETARIPAIHAPTLKLGLVSGLDAALTPAIQWQAYSFAARRDHMSLLHADLGYSGRGLFLGVAATINPFLDLGLARRLNGRGIRPYLSLHVVF